MGGFLVDSITFAAVDLPTGGPGGPTLSTSIPQEPRIVAQLDSIALSLIGSGLWVSLTTHSTTASSRPDLFIISLMVLASRGSNGRHCIAGLRRGDSRACHPGTDRTPVAPLTLRG